MIEKIDRVLTISDTILQEKKLSQKDKFIYAVFSFLDKEKGCYAKNKEMAKVCGCSEQTVARAISKLTKLGYLYVSFDEGNRCIHVTLFDNRENKNGKI